MRPDPIELPHPPQATDEESRERDNACLEIELDGRAGLGRLFDARLFQPARVNTRGDSLRHSASTPESGRRRSSLRLRPVESNSISTRTPGRSWGGSLSRRSVPPRHALARPHGGGEPRAGRPSPPIGRSETSHSGKRTRTSRGVYALFIGGMRDRAAASRLADSLAGLEGVERCHVSLWSHRITIDCGPGAADWPVARWTAWSESWRGGGPPIRGKPP